MTPRLLNAALGAGFYRFWHVPHPDALLDAEQTRRADRSVIAPAAMALLCAAAWFAGQVVANVLLGQPVATPPEALPWPAQVLVVLGMLGVAVAAAWWLGTAPVRTRVARAVEVGYVVRVPDDSAGSTQPLHAAVTELGRALRDLAEDRALAERAFTVLRASAAALPEQGPGLRPDQRRLRRRCLRLAQRLRGDMPDETTDPATDARAVPALGG